MPAPACASTLPPCGCGSPGSAARRPRLGPRRGRGRRRRLRDRRRRGRRRCRARRRTAFLGGRQHEASGHVWRPAPSKTPFPKPSPKPTHHRAGRRRKRRARKAHEARARAAAGPTLRTTVPNSQALPRGCWPRSVPNSALPRHNGCNRLRRGQRRSGLVRHCPHILRRRLRRRPRVGGERPCRALRRQCLLRARGDL